MPTQLVTAARSRLAGGPEGLGYLERSPGPTDGAARPGPLHRAESARQRAAPAEIAGIEAALLRRQGPGGTGLRGALARAIGAPTG